MYKPKGAKGKMRKACISFLVIGIIVLSGIGLIFNQAQPVKEYLRIHVRANSNMEVDQSVKYLVKDKVLDFLTPYIADCKTKEQATAMLNSNLDSLKAVCDKVLKESGFNYFSKVSIKREEFPFRSYNGVDLEQGFYDALIIELGSGAGDNWWCVVYPPLCFVGQGEYVYRSKIKDVINDFFCKEKSV